ncbi:putative serine/threonine-protein kinase pknH [Patulibacter medicamentivorans]|uniref:non-specific serine/threonine protein kinase n=1 Tax=Patulibacter medicamentivorans TaxID=1097667 RepID=H0E299_9ACTN|nr:serine/threonine-protein kinase [Patulibacter medicamentivorans]EHN12197.1 putative serine/threonine-protein kinase pknH [Patulibacter medicamentivorans]
MQLRPGEIVDGYRIQRPIGRGGMGAVYLAEHLSLRRPVALKIVTAALAEDPAFRERFEREARLAARLDHPNVVAVYDAGVHEAGPWLAMRYVDGQDLSRRLRAAEGGRLTPEAAVRVIEQVAAGLDHAHAAGLVHRDVKPANVLIEDGDAGRALLADFGLTKEVGDADDLTATGVVVGSVDYLAPERIAHGHVDGRADVYALAAMLWTLLTGRPPFDGQTATKLYRHVHAPRPEPSRLDPGLAGFDAVVARGMAIDPDQRYASAGDLARRRPRRARGPAAGRDGADRGPRRGRAGPGRRGGRRDRPAPEAAAVPGWRGWRRWCGGWW